MLYGGQSGGGPDDRSRRGGPTEADTREPLSDEEFSALTVLTSHHHSTTANIYLSCA